MGNKRSKLRWGVEQRLEFMGTSLFWEGRVNCNNLMRQFRVSVNQASPDLRRYIGFAPDKMVHDKSVGTYIHAPEFKSPLLGPAALCYFTQLWSGADGILDREDQWIADLLLFASVQMPMRGVRPVTLRSIRRPEAIEAKYHSMSNTKQRWRWIAPQVIGFNGYRWCTRAFCQTDEALKDFLLSRLLKVRDIRESNESAKDDHDWNTEIILEIRPHPAHSDAQADIIALNYEIRRDSARVGQTLLYNVLKRFGFDTDPTAKEPQDQQIALLGGRP